MKFPRSFYKAFDEHRGKYGETEYDARDMLLAFIPILDTFLTGDDKQALAIKLDILTEIEAHKVREPHAPGESVFPFMFDETVALGGRQRIKRGWMTDRQIIRRKIILDDNLAAQNEAWRNETQWLNRGLTELADCPAETKIRDVLNEDGTPKRDAA